MGGLKEIFIILFISFITTVNYEGKGIKEMLIKILIVMLIYYTIKRVFKKILSMEEGTEAIFEFLGLDYKEEKKIYKSEDIFSKNSRNKEIKKNILRLIVPFTFFITLAIIPLLFFL